MLISLYRGYASFSTRVLRVFTLMLMCSVKAMDIIHFQLEFAI